jgi:hypothetical protein
VDYNIKTLPDTIIRDGDCNKLPVEYGILKFKKNGRITYYSFNFGCPSTITKYPDLIKFYKVIEDLILNKPEIKNLNLPENISM